MAATIASLAELDQNLADVVTQLVDAVGRMDGDLQNLRTQLSNTALSAEDQATLDASTTQLQNTLDRAKAVVDQINTDDPAPVADPGTQPADGGSDTPPVDTGAGDGSTDTPAPAPEQPSA